MRGRRGDDVQVSESDDTIFNVHVVCDINVDVDVHIHVYVDVNVHIHVYVHVHVHINIHWHIHVDVDAHIDVFTDSNSDSDAHAGPAAAGVRHHPLEVVPRQHREGVSRQRWCGRCAKVRCRRVCTLLHWQLVLLSRTVL
jgi:hypothetical protein